MNDNLMTQVIDTLEFVGCQFFACDGPTLDPVPMGTCVVCATLAQVRVAAGRPARADDEMTAEERLEDHRRYMAAAVSRG